MTCGIYMIQNTVNGKIYIGQAVDIERRWVEHKTELRGNHHYNEHLQRAWNNYGESNFEFTIVCECEENQLNTMEEYYIFELMSYDKRVGYNKNYGGSSGRPTEEAKKKMSENNAKYWKGKTHSEETRKKMSESTKGENHPLYGKHPTEETRKKMSEARKGKYKGRNSPMYGKHPTEETRKKLSDARKGKTLSEETKEKIGEANRGENNPNSIPVVQLTLEGELVKVYDSSGETTRNGFSQGNIWSCCKGKRKTNKGYKWMYLSDYESMKKEG